MKISYFVKTSLIISILGLFFACAAKPTEAECRQSLMKAMELTGMTRDALDKMGKESTLFKSGAALCVKNKSRKRVLCEIAARSIDDMKACK